MAITTTTNVKVQTWSKCAADNTPYRNAKPPAASQQQQLHYSLTTEITADKSQVSGHKTHVTRHTPLTTASTRCYLRKNVR